MQPNLLTAHMTDLPDLRPPEAPFRPSRRRGSPPDLVAAARLLERSGDFRILRRLVPRELRPACMPKDGDGLRLGIVLDVETTGLDPSCDEIVELGMLAFSFDDHGIRDLVGAFDGLREPSVKMPPDVAALTGLTDRMLRGRRMDPAEVEAFVGSADLLIAHNARFDRPFCERFHPAFRDKSWACSMQEVPWKDLGVDGMRLSHVLSAYGVFHDGHRALSDCHALFEVLSAPAPVGGCTAFACLLASSMEASVEIRAVGAPFAAKNELKARGYKWIPGTDGIAKAWTISLPKALASSETDFLKSMIYRDATRVIPTKVMDARSRYRS